jgi:hypothetical protein
MSKDECAEFGGSLQEMEVAAAELLEVGDVLFKHGEPSDPALVRRYRLYKRVKAAVALLAGQERVVALRAARIDGDRMQSEVSPAAHYRLGGAGTLGAAISLNDDVAGHSSPVVICTGQPKTAWEPYNKVNILVLMRLNGNAHPGRCNDVGVSEVCRLEEVGGGKVVDFSAIVH